MSVDQKEYIQGLIRYIQKEKENIIHQRDARKGDATEFFAAIVVFDNMIQELGDILSGHWGASRVTLEEGLRRFFAEWRKQESGIHERGEWNNRDIPSYDRGNNGAILWFLNYCDMFPDKDDPGHIWEYCHIERDKLDYKAFQFRAEEEGKWRHVFWESPTLSLSRGLLSDRDFDPELMNHPVAYKAWEELEGKLLADGWEILDPIGNYLWWRRSFRRKPR